MNGAAHRIALAFAAPVVAWAAYRVNGDFALSACACAGCVVGMPVNSDLDQEANLKGWRFIFWPYAKLLAHRSFLSHFPIVCTAVRLAYIAIPAALVWSAMGLPNVPAWMVPYVVWAAIGLAVADGVHFICDLL